MIIKSKYIRFIFVLMAVLSVLFYSPFSWIDPFDCFMSFPALLRSLLVILGMVIYIVFEWRKIFFGKKNITFMEAFILVFFISFTFRYLIFAMMELIAKTIFAMLLVFLWYPFLVMYVIVSCFCSLYMLNKADNNISC